MPHALFVESSPRKSSISTFVLEVLREELAEAGWTDECLDASAMDRIRQCGACHACRKEGRCLYDDEATRFHDVSVARTDLLLLACPIYFQGPPAALKALIDRAQPLWVRRNILEDPALVERPVRPAVAVYTAGGPPTPTLFGASQSILRAYCKTLGFRIGEEMEIARTDELDNDGLLRLRREARALADRVAAQLSGEPAP